MSNSLIIKRYSTTDINGDTEYCVTMRDDYDRTFQAITEQEFKMKNIEFWKSITDDVDGFGDEKLSEMVAHRIDRKLGVMIDGTYYDYAELV